MSHEARRATAVATGAIPADPRAPARLRTLERFKEAFDLDFDLLEHVVIDGAAQCVERNGAVRVDDVQQGVGVDDAGVLDDER
jgi:hypothetical protein